jgi:alpha-L-rhamnosidase
MMTDMATAIGKPANAKTYSELYENIRAAFQAAYVQPDGTVANGTQTSYVLALQMKLLPPALESAAVDKLVANIEAHNWHLTTGFLGTPFLLFALSEHGRADVAYRLLLTDTYPSWGYMLSKGATTWWERWNGDTGDPSMNSYNHYAFGSVVAWVYRCVAGIDTVPTGPGFHEILIHPHPDSRITSARGEYASVYGKIVTEWNGTLSGTFTLKVTVPANTRAKIVLPPIASGQVTQNGHRVATEDENGTRVLRIGSGSYDFEVVAGNAAEHEHRDIGEQQPRGTAELRP